MKTKKVTRNSIQKVKQEIDISQHIARSVSLSESGEYLVGRSPFAPNSANDSLLVMPQYQKFRCQITGKRGDVIDFEGALKETHFMKALLALALEYQIPLEYEKNQARREFAGAN